MAGITRINIVSDWNDWRTEMSRKLAPYADELYFDLWAKLGMSLESGTETLDCKKEDAVSRYDWKEGIDCILRFSDRTKATLQEKYLTYNRSTVTFEEKKTSGAEGAWYYCTAQYYFVGYVRGYKRGDMTFNDWILVDLPALQRLERTSRLPWRFNVNKHDHRAASFRYMNFDEIPIRAIVARMNGAVARS